MERFKKIMEVPQFVQNPVATMKEHVVNSILIEEKREQLKSMARAAHLIKEGGATAGADKKKMMNE